MDKVREKSETRGGAMDYFLIEKWLKKSLLV